MAGVAVLLFGALLAPGLSRGAFRAACISTTPTTGCAPTWARDPAGPGAPRHRRHHRDRGHPATFQNLGVLAVIVAIRTLLSFTLELEVSGRWPWQRERPEDTAAR